MEVAPGIHRIESVLGPRPFSQYLLRDERSLLFDTGVRETPAEVILPFLDGLQPDLVLNSHADVDHYGGNAAIRAAAPRALLLAHELDVPWIENTELILRERYHWYEPYGLSYEPDALVWLREALGPDTPVDMHLRAGERIRLGPGLTVEVLHLPGHTAGHIGLWDPASRTAIVMDAVLGRGLLDLDGNVIHPPPYFEIEPYLGTARRLQALAPERLLTAHYDVIEGASRRPLPGRHDRLRRRRAARDGSCAGRRRRSVAGRAVRPRQPATRPVHVDGERARRPAQGPPALPCRPGPRARGSRDASLDGDRLRRQDPASRSSAASSSEIPKRVDSTSPSAARSSSRSSRPAGVVSIRRFPASVARPSGVRIVQTLARVNGESGEVWW